ncbi:Two-component transcriptional response regulator, LuxR family [hydrothermal vent metagenome]|uniref:Two-component transcriptional response regulator, LuxR family n=1 Tax=hydrothermal vent metagenome TaxID=652676 RepID=A0A3B1DJ09_9ZZZZ
MRILVIEDEKKISSFVERGLKEQHYAVDVAFDGEEGLYMVDINPYDLILMDIMLPKKSGIEICKELREKKNNTPILMLTAKGSVNDKVLGLNAGADDYLSKPFSFSELLARIRALLRRQREEKVDYLRVADLELNMLNHNVQRGGKAIMLTNKEYGLLQYLMLNTNQVVTRTMISEHVWKESFDSFTNVIDVHIKYLRDKIDKGVDKKLLHTVRGAGYMIKE